MVSCSDYALKGKMVTFETILLYAFVSVGPHMLSDQGRFLSLWPVWAAQMSQQPVRSEPTECHRGWMMMFLCDASISPLDFLVSLLCIKCQLFAICWGSVFHWSWTVELLTLWMLVSCPGFQTISCPPLWKFLFPPKSLEHWHIIWYQTNRKEICLHG